MSALSPRSRVSSLKRDSMYEAFSVNERADDQCDVFTCECLFYNSTFYRIGTLERRSSNVFLSLTSAQPRITYVVLFVSDSTVTVDSAVGARDIRTPPANQSYDDIRKEKPRRTSGGINLTLSNVRVECKLEKTVRRRFPRIVRCAGGAVRV